MEGLPAGGVLPQVMAVHHLPIERWPAAPARPTGGRRRQVFSSKRDAGVQFTRRRRRLAPRRVPLSASFSG